MATVDVVTRFAPSPTGALHVGGARTALYNWAFARGRGGRLILRMEDTDRKRSSAAAATGILRDLRWLGLDWDEGPAGDNEGEDPHARQTGDHGPYFQSERLQLYDEQIERLLKAGTAYVPDDEPQIVRFRMGRDVRFDDAVYGTIHVGADELDDFVIRKGDGFPTFHLAVVVDDALMGVTHVIRGQEHLSNTPRHVSLQDALGFDRPIYAHTPSILNADGSKMSKRDKAKVARKAARQWLEIRQDDKGALAALAGIDVKELESFLKKETDAPTIAEALAAPACLNVTLPEIDVADFRRNGYLPEVLCNYIALLGWNPGNDVERFDNDFLKRTFDLDRIGKANPRFDRDKLLSFDRDAIAALPLDDWTNRLRDHLHAQCAMFRPLVANGERLRRFARAYHERSRTMQDPAHQGAFFVLDDQSIEYDVDAVRKVLAKGDGAGFDVLKGLLASLNEVAPDNWSAESIHATIQGCAEARSLKMGKVAQPIRVAVSGSAVSPPIDDTLMILGRTSTLARIQRCLSECSG